MAGYSPNTKNPKRITDLDPFEDSEHPNTIRDILYNVASAADWHMAIDYRTYQPDPDAPNIDYGTKRIPVSRVAFRNEGGLIPRQMLPDYVEDVVYGTFTPDADTSTFAGYAKFVTNDHYEPGPDEDPSLATNFIEYRYPYTATQQQPWIKVAEENLIYMDTSGLVYDKMQFRFKEPSQSTQPNEFHGFNVLPSTKVITSDYGINVDNQALTTDISVKKPDKRTANISGTYTGSSSCRPITLSNLTPGVTYLMTANMSLHPDSNTLTAMIEDFTIVITDANNNILTSVTCDVNMAYSSSQCVSKSALITVPSNTSSISISASLPTLPNGKSVIVDVSSSIEFAEVL